VSNKTIAPKLYSIATDKSIRLPKEAIIKISSCGRFYAFAMGWGDFEVLSNSKNPDELRHTLTETLIFEGVAYLK